MSRRSTLYVRYDHSLRPVAVPVIGWSHVLNGNGYGADTAVPPTTPASLQQYFAPAAQAIAAYEQSSDPRVQVELLKAKIHNMQSMKAKFPAFSFFYDNEIAKLKARLKAVSAQVATAAEKDQATKDWRKLGYTASGVGILVGIGLLGLIVIGGAKLVAGR